MHQFNSIINFPKRLQEAYKIKIGEKGQIVKSKTGKDFRLPVKNDHFTITHVERDDKGNFVIHKKVMEELVKYNIQFLKDEDHNVDIKNIKPKDYDYVKDVPIRFLYDETEKNFVYEYAYYVGKKLQCHGNKKEFEWEPKKDNSSIVKAHKKGMSCEECQYYKRGDCKIKCKLQCYLECLPELGSVAVYRSSGFNSTQYLATSIDDIKGRANGILAGIPLVLTVRPQAATPTSKGKDISTTIYAVNVIFRVPKELLKKREVLEIGTEISKHALQIANVRKTNQKEWERVKSEAEDVVVKVLDDEDEENIQEIKEEFYPETVQKEVEQENKESQQNEEQRKIYLLDIAKKRMFAAGKKPKAVNQALAVVRSKTVAEIETWFKKLFKELPVDEPQTEEAPGDSPESAAEEAPGDMTEPATEPEPAVELEPATEASQEATGAPGAPGELELDLDKPPAEEEATTEPETKHPDLDIPDEGGDNLF